MRIELRGLLAAVIAGPAVVGLTFGVSALVLLSQPPERPHPAPSSGTGAPTSAASIAEGHRFYTQSCASCHGADARGAFGPNLHNEDESDAKITATIKNGRGRMPAFGGKYDAAQTAAMVAYIRSLK